MYDSIYSYLIAKGFDIDYIMKNYDCKGVSSYRDFFKYIVKGEEITYSVTPSINTYNNYVKAMFDTAEKNILILNKELLLDIKQHDEDLFLDLKFQDKKAVENCLK